MLRTVVILDILDKKRVYMSLKVTKSKICMIGMLTGIGLIGLLPLLGYMGVLSYHAV